MYFLLSVNTACDIPQPLSRHGSAARRSVLLRLSSRRSTSVGFQCNTLAFGISFRLLDRFQCPGRARRCWSTLRFSIVIEVASPNARHAAIIHGRRYVVHRHNTPCWTSTSTLAFGVIRCLLDRFRRHGGGVSHTVPRPVCSVTHTLPSRQQTHTGSLS